MIGLRALISRSGEPDRRTRRLFIVAGLVLIPLVVVALEISTRARLPHPFGLLALVLLLALVSLPLLVISEFRRNVMRRRNADERERRRRDEAYRISYRVVELAIVLGFGAVAVFRDQIAAILAVDWFLIVFPIYGYVLFLPYMVFAWREPDGAD